MNGRHQFDIDGSIRLKPIANDSTHHGSIRGLLLFIVFTNDLPRSVTRSIIVIFADDTTMTASALVELSPSLISLQGDITEVNKWTMENRMSP